MRDAHFHAEKQVTRRENPVLCVPDDDMVRRMAGQGNHLEWRDVEADERARERRGSSPDHLPIPADPRPRAQHRFASGVHPDREPDLRQRGGAARVILMLVRDHGATQPHSLQRPHEIRADPRKAGIHEHPMDDVRAHVVANRRTTPRAAVNPVDVRLDLLDRDRHARRR
jgi:hypothetical protein